MVSGLAPGRLAVISRVGKSTFGRSLTGKPRYATVPNRAIAPISRLVAIGRSIKVWEMFIRASLFSVTAGGCVSESRARYQKLHVGSAGTATGSENLPNM